MNSQLKIPNGQLYSLSFTAADLRSDFGTKFYADDDAVISYENARENICALLATLSRKKQELIEAQAADGVIQQINDKLVELVEIRDKLHMMDTRGVKLVLDEIIPIQQEIAKNGVVAWS